MMKSNAPIDLPTLRNHSNHFLINEKPIPILYRYKSGIYYPYVAFDLVLNDLIEYSSTWNSTHQLPLLPMTLNERNFYQKLCPNLQLNSSSRLISCALIDQFLQLVEHLKQLKTSANSDRIFGHFQIDIYSGSIREIDLFHSTITTKYNNYRSIHCPSIQTAKRQLCFDDENVNLSSIGGYLQLDRCIYPYVISSSDILLNLNDLRKPFASTLNILMPFFHSQSKILLENYTTIVDYGTKFIKNYKYYSKNLENQFIRLEHLLLLHRSILFVQIFPSDRTSLIHLHENYRGDFSHLLSENLSHCGYFNDQPCLNGWSLYDSMTNDRDKPSRLATKDEILLINSLFIYNHREIQVHHFQQETTQELILVQHSSSLLSSMENFQSIQNEHMRKRSSLFE